MGRRPVLSFGGSKLLTAGRGGAILTSQAEIAERIKRHVLRGNDAYPLSEIQAAILRPQIDQVDALNERRRKAVCQLGSLFEDVSGLTPLQLPTHDILPAYYKVGFRYRSEAFNGLSRDQFAEACELKESPWTPGLRGNHLIHGSRRFRAADELFAATQADTEMLTLHHPVLLAGNSAMDEIVVAIKKVHRNASEIALRGG